MSKTKYLIAGCLLLTSAFSVNAQSSEDAPRVQKKVTVTTPAVQATSTKNAYILNAHAAPQNLQPAPVVAKPLEITKAETAAPLRLVSISATEMPVQVTQQPAPTTTTAAKPAVIEAAIPSAPVQKVSPGALSNKVVTDAPITTAPKVKAEEVSKTTSSSVALPTIVLTKDNGTVEAKTTAPVNQVQQIMGEPKPTEAVVTPPSTPPVQKAPVKE